MTVTETHILDEIKRTAEENGGQPLGRKRFYAETGIKESDWSGRYWVRWSDAMREAGYSPNQLQSAYNEQFLLEKLAALTQELGHFPVIAELKLKARQDPMFPSHNTFARFGGKAKLAQSLLDFCQRREGYKNVVDICALIPSNKESEYVNSTEDNLETFGSVYLLKSGRYHKIGRTNSVGRREHELAMQLPERAVIIHSIKTDDPAGIENYWHRRFKERRKNGEWFELSASDVTSFKRRKFM
jgi:hypothetical protein